MSNSIDEDLFTSALRSRLFGNTNPGLLEALINAAALHSSLLRLSSFQSIRFSLDRSKTLPVGPPEYHRLVLVLPESFEATWVLHISGHFMVKYQLSVGEIPQGVGPLKILYSGVIVPRDGGLSFKNERVKLM